MLVGFFPFTWGVGDYTSRPKTMIMFRVVRALGRLAKRLGEVFRGGLVWSRS